MVQLDFTQSYPTLAAVILILSGFYVIFHDGRRYTSLKMPREASWSKYIGVCNIIFGALLYIMSVIWTMFIW